MGQTRAAITALGIHVPERVVTNADLEKIVDTNDEWIRTRTGIEQRHVVEPGTPTSVSTGPTRTSASIAMLPTSSASCVSAPRRTAAPAAWFHR